MNYYLISLGHPRDTRAERNYVIGGDGRAVVVRAEDQTQALQVANDLLVIVSPAYAMAHEVRFPNPDPNMS